MVNCLCFMKEKEKYVAPEIHVLEFTTEHLIASSGEFDPNSIEINGMNPTFNDPFYKEKIW